MISLRVNIATSQEVAFEMVSIYSILQQRIHFSLKRALMKLDDEIHLEG